MTLNDSQDNINQIIDKLETIQELISFRTYSWDKFYEQNPDAYYKCLQLIDESHRLIKSLVINKIS